MAIGAVRVMAAGKAGLESLPFFVDELLAQDIPLLEPWAIDHSPDQRQTLHGQTEGLISGRWTKIRGIQSSDLARPMSYDSTANRRLVRQINPLAADVGQVADCPTQIAAFCRRQISEHCRETEQLWERFKNREGLTGSAQLAVVIPYCPEGPTSGTVGMYLGAALRKHFMDRDKADQLVVWGIELCPPVMGAQSTESNHPEVGNLFRGYIARRELLEGVPLSPEDPSDEIRQQCFDINIAFDGGTVQLGESVSPDFAWAALDRGAAQMTACLLNGAAGGDEPESTLRLRQGRRWNAYLAHVVSDRSYSPECRYLRYRVALPWRRDRTEWNRKSLAAKVDQFVKHVDAEIAPQLPNEPDARVATYVNELVIARNSLKALPLDTGLLGVLTGRHKTNRGTAEGWLSQVESRDQDNYEQTRKLSQQTSTILPRTDPFCVNIVLAESQRIEAAETARDNGIHGPVADVIGDAGVATVRQKITEMCEAVLKRDDCSSLDINSEALFDEIMSISIGDWSRGTRNNALRPTREILRDYIAEQRRDIPGAFSELTFDLNTVVDRAYQQRMEREDKARREAARSQTAGGDSSTVEGGQSRDLATPTSAEREASGSSTAPAPRSAEPAAMRWKLSEVDHDVPVEYSVLILGRVRDGDGFKDVSTYSELEEIHDRLVENLSSWRQLAHHYGVKPPPNLFSDEDGPSGVPPGATVSHRTVEVVVDVLEERA